MRRGADGGSTGITPESILEACQFELEQVFRSRDGDQVAVDVLRVVAAGGER